MRVGVAVVQGDLKPVKERFFFLHTSCEVPFCTFISFANFKQAESECKKKNYHSVAAYFEGPFFFLLIKGVLKKNAGF